MNLGIRAHDLGRWPLEKSADVLGATGLSCLQLALPKALVGFEPRTGFLSPTRAREIAKAYGDRGLSLAVLGCYIDPRDPDSARLEAQLVRFEELLRFAPVLGGAVVATETGPGGTEADFDRVVASVRRLCRVAEQEGSRVGIEPVAHAHVIDSVQRLEALVEAVGSKALGVVYDPANLLSLDEAPDPVAAVEHALSRLGPLIAAVHAKDCAFADGRKIGDLPAGSGVVPYPVLLRWLSQRPELPVLMEEVSPASWRGVEAFLRRAAGTSRP